METGVIDARERLGHHIGGIEPAAEPDLEQQRIGGMAREQQEAGRGLHFEHGDRRVAVGALAGREHLDEFGVADQHAAARPAEAEALVEPHQVGRGIDMHARARRLEHGAHERDGRALAVGAGDMDDRRQLAFRVAERFEQAPHAVERQVDPLGVERQEPRQDRIYMGHSEVIMGRSSCNGCGAKPLGRRRRL